MTQYGQTASGGSEDAGEEAASFPDTVATVAVDTHSPDATEPGVPVTLKRREAGPVVPSDADSMSLAAGTHARSARDAFRAARKAADAERAAANYHEAKQELLSAWKYAGIRNQSFRDVLALLDAALRRREFEEFTETQRDILAQAFVDLPRNFLDAEQVSAHTRNFAVHGIDITGPIRAAAGKTFRVRLEVTE